MAKWIPSLSQKSTQGRLERETRNTRFSRNAKETTDIEPWGIRDLDRLPRERKEPMVQLLMAVGSANLGPHHSGRKSVYQKANSLEKVNIFEAWGSARLAMLREGQLPCWEGFLCRSPKGFPIP